MNWDAIGAVGETVGALGVIFSLVYLALQIRQNSKLLTQNTQVARANASIHSSSQGANFTRAIAFNPTIARIWSTPAANLHQLEESDRRSYDFMLISQIIDIDANHFLFRQGTLDGEIYGIWDGILDSILDNPRFLELWNAGVIDDLTTDSLSAYVREKFEARKRAEK